MQETEEIESSPNAGVFIAIGCVCFLIVVVVIYAVRLHRKKKKESKYSDTRNPSNVHLRMSTPCIDEIGRL